ncbi:hypothetical protein KKF91_18550 [Myxococcota bacterium]|nr:hypothetical protein [Myxococcota bacterium]MBU1432543.1 hypothetical protein [Myxococcota bacterium]MBU1898832.1 hypothetical protein [Myxococcota bacterium]
MKSPLHEATRALLLELSSSASRSRNQHFELYEDAHAREARRIHRYLESLAEDLKAHPSHARLIEDTLGGFTLRVEYPEIRGRREAHLSDFELHVLLKHHPWIAPLVGLDMSPEKSHAQG